MSTGQDGSSNDIDLSQENTTDRPKVMVVDDDPHDLLMAGWENKTRVGYIDSWIKILKNVLLAAKIVIVWISHNGSLLVRIMAIEPQQVYHNIDIKHQLQFTFLSCPMFINS